MFNGLALTQCRDAIRRHISRSPSRISITRYPMINNSFGVLIPDLAGLATIHVYKVRISHEQKSVQGLRSMSSGLDSNNSLFLLADHNATINEDESFLWQGKAYQIKNVDIAIKFGGVISYRAQLV